MKKKAMRVKIRSRIPFPPTRVFKDRKKESRKRACRGKLKSFPFFLSGQRKHIKAKIKDIIKKTCQETGLLKTIKLK